MAGMIVHPVEAAVAARVRRLRAELGWTLDEARPRSVSVGARSSKSRPETLTQA
jgi:hypothetical protein